MIRVQSEDALLERRDVLGRSTVSTKHGGRSKGKPKGEFEGDVTPFTDPAAQLNDPTGCEVGDWILVVYLGCSQLISLVPVDRRAFTAHTSLSRDKTHVSPSNRRMEGCDSVSKMYFSCEWVGLEGR